MKLRLGNSDGAHVLTVPKAIVNVLLEAGWNDAEFSCELTDEGILYRPSSPKNPAPVPSWVGEGR